MPHVHTEPGQHDTTASALIIRFDTREPQLLLHLHKKLNTWMQPGGHVELLENPWQAVLHEIVEETGYSLRQLDVLQPRNRLMNLTGATLHPVAVCQNTHDFGGITSHRHTDTVYAFATDSEPSGKPGDGESNNLKWVTLGELQELPAEQIFVNIREMAIYALGECALNWERLALSEFET